MFTLFLLTLFSNMLLYHVFNIEIKKNLIDSSVLGMDVFDISNITPTNITSLFGELNSYSSRYYVTKIPSSDIDLINLLENNGFHFIEFQIKYTNKTSNYANELDINKISFIKVDSKTFYEYYITKASESLKIDRFSKDPLLSFNTSISAKRYKEYLLKSIDEQDEDMYLIYSSDYSNYIGFFSFKKNNKECATLFLGGLFSEYRKKGLGKFYVMAYHTCLYNSGISSFISNMSGSNISICNLNISKFGGIILDTYVVMRKLT